MTSSELSVRAPKVAEAARLLIEARASRQPIQAPPPELAPADEAEAWAIHEAVVASLGPVVAWKTGAPTPEAEPGMGLITADTVRPSPAVVAADAAGTWSSRYVLATVLFASVLFLAGIAAKLSPRAAHLVVVLAGLTLVGAVASLVSVPALLDGL